MWLLNFVPDFVFHLILLVGVLGLLAGFVLDKIPFIETNAKTIQLIAIILTVIGVWFEGGIARDEAYQKEISAMQVQVAQAETESADANLKLIEALKKNELILKDKHNASRNVVNQVVSKYDGQCNLSNAFIRLHDSASQDKFPESTSEFDGKTSDVKPSEVLNTVIDNYSVCYGFREKLIKWQDWYEKQKEILDK